MAYHPQLGGESPVLPVRVFVLAGDVLAGDGLRASLRDDARLVCVAQAADAEVLVWDLGSEGAAPLDGAHPALGPVRAGRQALIMLVPNEVSAAQALQAGALGVLQRRGCASTLTAAIMAVRLGLCVLDAGFAEHYLELPKPAAAPGETLESLESLTPREREVLEALALGLSNRAIARRLGVSVHTVKFHVNGIFAKLQVDNRAGAVAKALRNGLLRV